MDPGESNVPLNLRITDSKHNLLFSAVERSSRLITHHWKATEARTQERQVIAAMKKVPKQNPKLPTGEQSFPGLGSSYCVPANLAVLLQYSIRYHGAQAREVGRPF